MLSEPNLKINKVVRMAQAFISDRLKPLGLSSGLFYFILELSEADGLSMQELSRAVLVDNAHTTRAVARLTALGFVAKRIDPNDSRSFLVFLTEKGRGASEAIRAVLLEWARIITAGVTEEEVATVYRVFDKYYANGSAVFRSKE